VYYSFPWTGPNTARRALPVASPRRMIGCKGLSPLTSKVWSCAIGLSSRTHTGMKNGCNFWKKRQRETLVQFEQITHCPLDILSTCGAEAQLTAKYRHANWGTPSWCPIKFLPMLHACSKLMSWLPIRTLPKFNNGPPFLSPGLSHCEAPASCPHFSRQKMACIFDVY
jgi:hypothetical protein